MSAKITSAFGDMLKNYRLAAGLTQEGLAERAGVSARNIQNLERGENKPLKDTARRLAEALGLDERERTLLLTAVIPVPRLRAAPTTALPPPAPPPVAPPAAPRHNLPIALSSFIGREHERERVGELLVAHRLVTLVGTGGVGKTRLALAVAEDRLDTFPDGVWLVELAPLADPALVPAALAQVLGLREEPGRPILETLSNHLKAQHLLLILDNCEHLVAACAALAAALLRACSEVRTLATSREALGVGGERRYRVPSLSVPDPKHLPAPDLAGSYEAVQLFVERATERRDDFALTEGNARAIAEVCAHLDGVPLAIELAAARAGSLSVAVIAVRLDERFRLLTGGSRDLPSRQRTLRAALDWSWELLTTEERALLARLAVFAGGWGLEAAEVVCAGEGVAPWAVLDGLDALVGKSLVQVDETGEEAGRYRLLETVRQYAAERLEELDQAAAARDRHLAWCLALAEQAEPELRGPEQGVWLRRLETEHDNLRAALGWARERRAGEEDLRLAAALWRFWEMRAYFGEGLGRLEEALVRGAGSAPGVRAMALNGAGMLASRRGDFARAKALHEEALALRRALGDTPGLAASLNNLGNIAYYQGDWTRTVALYEESLALYRELRHTVGIATGLNNLAVLAADMGNIERAMTLHEEGLAMCHERGDTWGIALALGNLGELAERQGDYARALAMHEESLALYRQLGDTNGIAWSLGNLGLLAADMNDHGRAMALHEEGLALYRQLGDKWGIAWSLGNLGSAARQDDEGRSRRLQQEGLALAREIGARDLLAIGLREISATVSALGAPLQAARLGGAAEKLREALGQPLTPAERGDHDRAVAATRAALGEAAFAAAWAEGRVLPLEEAVALALADPDHLDR